MNRFFLEAVVTNQGGAMEQRNHFKNGRSLKSQTSRGNFINKCVRNAVWILTIGAMIMPTFQSCNSNDIEEPIDPFKDQKEDCAKKKGEFFWDEVQNICTTPLDERIKELTAQEKKQGNEVRAATVPALTNPVDIQAEYWADFTANNNMSLLKSDVVIPAANLLDSAQVHMKTIDGKYKNHPTNSAHINPFYEKCKSYIPIAEELGDSTLEKVIKEVTALEKEKKGIVKKAMEPMYPWEELPGGLTGFWEGNFNKYNEERPALAVNFLDTTKIFVQLIDEKIFAYHPRDNLPEINKPHELLPFYDGCVDYIPTAENLYRLLEKQAGKQSSK